MEKRFLSLPHLLKASDAGDGRTAMERLELKLQSANRVYFAKCFDNPRSGGGQWMLAQAVILVMESLTSGFCFKYNGLSFEFTKCSSVKYVRLM